MTDPLKSLSSVLPERVEQLALRASAASSLTEKVRLGLPEPVRAHVIGAARRGDELVILVDSAAWSARVRYAARALNAQLASAEGPGFSRIRVRVRAPL